MMSFLQRTGRELFATPAWDLNQPERWKVLHRFCVWFLKKTEVLTPHFDERDIVKQVAIDPQQAASRVIEMADLQFQAMAGKRPSRIFVGPEQFRSLAYSIAGQSRQLTYLDVPVEMIPWMNGVLVV